MSRERAIVRSLLKQHSLKARRSMGQNFFLHPGLLEPFVAERLTGKELVVEVGPGLGFLTELLLPRARKVIAVELDAHLAALLRTTFATSENLEVVEADVRTYMPPDEPYQIFANLPYYLSAPFLRRYLSGPVRRPERMVLMLQREVAEKLTGPDASLLALSVAAYGETRILAHFDPSHFEPQPQVHSSLVEIVVAPSPRISTPERDFFAVAHAAFQAPRKMLSNTLRAMNLPPGELDAAFVAAGVAPAARPEMLSLADFDRLAGEILARRPKS